MTPNSAAFVLLVIAVGALFVSAVGPGARRPGESAESTRRWSILAAAIVVVWLGVAALAATRGVLQQFSRVPPPAVVLAGAYFTATAVLAFSPVGTRLAGGVGLLSLVAFQAFRIPLELWLHHMAREGALPIQMTFAGWNFDIATGFGAAAIAIGARRGTVPRAVILAWNTVGLALLFTIVAIAILSMPTPFRRFMNEPSNTIVAQFPFIWLPTFLVQAAWFGHLLVFRALADDSRGGTTG